MADPLDILTGTRSPSRGDEWLGTLANMAQMVASIPERRARAAQQRMQMEQQQLALQSSQQKVADLKAIDEAFASGDSESVLSRLPGHLQPTIRKQFAEIGESNAKRTKALEDARKASEDTIARALSVVREHGYDPRFAQGTISTLKGMYKDDPQRMQELDLFEKALHENPTPDHVKFITDALIGRSEAQRKADEEAAKSKADIASTEAQTRIRQQEEAGTKPIQPTDAARIAAENARAEAARAAQAAAQAEAARSHRANEAIAAGNLGVARQREAREAAKPQGADKPPTGQQRRALGFFNRARQADEDINPIEDEVSKMGFVGTEWMKHAPNWAQSDIGQKYNQAQRAFTEARLRKDSGATIKDSEYENDRKTYFAEPGDNAATLAQKRRARAQLLASLGAEAGAAALREFYGDEGDVLVQGYRQKSAAKEATKNPYR